MGKYNAKSKVKDIVADPAAAAILDKYLPNFSTSPEAKPAYGMGIKAMCNFPQTPIDKEQTAALLAELEALE